MCAIIYHNKDFYFIIFLCCGLHLHCSFCQCLSKSCLGTVVNGEHTRNMYINKDMNECND